MQRLDSYTNLRAGMDLARQGDLAVPRLMSHPWRSQHDFYVEKFGKWKITKRITSKSSRFLLNAEWWMETIHVYTISGWSKLVEKWESKTFIFKGEESWDDISFSWYQWNKIKADIWQTSWQNGTLKKHTSSTITVYALSFTKHDFQELKQYNPDLQKPQAKHADTKGNMCWIRPTIWMADLVTPLRICHPGSVITRMS